MGHIRHAIRPRYEQVNRTLAFEEVYLVDATNGRIRVLVFEALGSSASAKSPMLTSSRAGL